MSEIYDECKKVFPNIDDNAALYAMEARALQSCHCFCLHVLQKAGAKVGEWTPLRLAAHLNHVECMKNLIEAGADVNYSEGLKSTAVQEAAEKGHEECVQIFVKSGVDVKSGVLSRAVLNNYKTIAEFLIKSGADVNEGSLGTAVEQGHKECVDLLLLSGAIVNNADHTHIYPPLIIATRNFRYEGCVETLISAGADVNSRGCDGITSLMYAAERGDEKMVDVLIKAGANVNELDDVGMNPLMRAVMGKNKTCVQMLIKAGADMSMPTELIAMSSLALAEASQTCADLVKLLIEAGADVNIPSVRGGIFAFSSHATVNSARMLLRAGAKINVFDHNNINTLKRIIAENNPRTLSKVLCMLLFAAGETIDGITVEQRDCYGISKLYVPVPDFLLHQDLRFCLKHLCREAMRKHLILLDRHTHLFRRVPRLGLPAALEQYLLYDMSLDGENDDHSTDECCIDTNE